MKLVQAYLPIETVHRLKIALAFRGQTITQWMNESAEATANAPQVAPKSRAKR